MVEIVRVRDFAVDQPVEPAFFVFGFFVAFAPGQQAVAGFFQFRGGVFQPFPVVGIAEMFGCGPEQGAGFAFIVVEVLDKTVFALAFEEEIDAAPGDFPQSERIEKLDDRRALRADGGIPADGGEQGAFGGHTGGHQVKMEQSGADAFVDGGFGHRDFCGFFQFGEPKPAAGVQMGLVIQFCQLRRALFRQRMVRNQHFKNGFFAGIDQDRHLFLGHQSAVQTVDRCRFAVEVTVSVRPADFADRLRAGNGVSGLEPGVGGRFRHIHCLDTDDADEFFFAPDRFRVEQVFHPGEIVFRQHIDAALGVSGPPVGAADPSGRERAVFQRGECGHIVLNVLFVLNRVKNRQHAVVQPVGHVGTAMRARSYLKLEVIL